MNKYNGVFRCIFNDGTHYYGMVVNDVLEGKGWMMNPASGYSCKGQFSANKANGWCKVKFRAPDGSMHYWEGGVRENIWHGLGIYTNVATGVRSYKLYEGTE